jgi:rubrerythrin
MGVKCSLLGHSFDDAEVERDREERGDEVVTIVREVEHCTRCDETRVVSENKEVTTVVEPDDVGVDDQPTSATRTIDPDATAGGVPDAAARSDDLDEYEPPEDPSEEDAEILGDDETPDRDPGEWPEEETADDATVETLTAEEVVQGGDDAADASTSDTGDEPQEDDEATAEAESLDSEPGASTDDGPTGGTFTVPDDRFRCPECGFATGAAGSSLRAGDACPECQRGYLETESGERN